MSIIVFPYTNHRLPKLNIRHCIRVVWDSLQLLMRHCCCTVKNIKVTLMWVTTLRSLSLCWVHGRNTGKTLFLVAKQRCQGTQSSSVSKGTYVGGNK